ncbi:hypothetical protein [Nonomuraea sp. NPDC050310]|uniref:hypothetical protein n=1 Tax=Nonomuraea sp. NPDC050310 TaxID=3154935 RepID=UPI00340D1CE8
MTSIKVPERVRELIHEVAAQLSKESGRSVPMAEAIVRMHGSFATERHRNRLAWEEAAQEVKDDTDAMARAQVTADRLNALLQARQAGR